HEKPSSYLRRFPPNLTLGPCLLVSALHEAGSLLLFSLAPSRFLLPFLKGFTCHKNSFSVRGAPVTALCPAHCLFSFRLLHAFFSFLEPGRPVPRPHFLFLPSLLRSRKSASFLPCRASPGHAPITSLPRSTQ